MPRNVRPFWFDLSVDGRNDIGTGPSGLEGGATCIIRIRHQDDVYTALRIECIAINRDEREVRVFADGRCVLTVTGSDYDDVDGGPAVCMEV